jgi:AraC family transcriptional regulator
MEPKIVTYPAFTVVGMKYRGKNENNEIKQMWGELNPRIKEIQYISGPAYGVCQDMEADGVFEYVAGMQVSQVDKVPQGMVSWEVPEQKYAAFPCTLPTLGEAYEYAFETWLPQSGFKRAGGPDFELYDDEFEVDIADSTMYIYIPIE